VSELLNTYGNVEDFQQAKSSRPCMSRSGDVAGMGCSMVAVLHIHYGLFMILITISVLRGNFFWFSSRFHPVRNARLCSGLTRTISDYVKVTLLPIGKGVRYCFLSPSSSLPFSIHVEDICNNSLLLIFRFNPSVQFSYDKNVGTF